MNYVLYPLLVAGGIVCLVFGWLMYLNWGTKVYMPALTAGLTFLAGSLATLLYSLKEETKRAAYYDSIIFDKSEYRPISPSRLEFMDQSAQLKQQHGEQWQDELQSYEFPSSKHVRRLTELCSFAHDKLPGDSEEDRASYCIELLQVALVNDLFWMHRTHQSGYTKSEEGFGYFSLRHHWTFELSKTENVFHATKTELGKLRFAMPGLFWFDDGTFSLPRGTEVSIIKPDGGSAFSQEGVVTLKKDKFFEVRFVVSLADQPKEGLMPEGLRLAINPETAKRFVSYPCLVKAEAKFDQLTALNPKTEEHKKWVDWMFTELGHRFNWRS